MSRIKKLPRKHRKALRSMHNLYARFRLGAFPHRRFEEVMPSAHYRIMRILGWVG